MQAMRVGQRHTGAGPVHRQLAAQCLQHRTHGGGAGQFAAAAVHQQGAQAFEHVALRLALAGQAEQPTHRGAGVLQFAGGGDEGQSRPQHPLAAVQPPQAVAQRQRLALLQAAGEAAFHAASLLQAARALQQ
ncbi:hypothetical protein D3C81_1431040 [compost metagenome]